MPKTPRFFCRGPRRTEAEVERLKATSAELESKRSLTRPQTRKLAELRSQLENPFRGCGTDLTDAILALPADGEDYELTCGECGTTFEAKRTPHGNDDSD